MSPLVRARVAAANAALAERRGSGVVRQPLPYRTVGEYVRAWNLAKLREAIREALGK